MNATKDCFFKSVTIWGILKYIYLPSSPFSSVAPVLCMETRYPQSSNQCIKQDNVLLINKQNMY